jgi:hypothetical protein
VGGCGVGRHTRSVPELLSETEREVREIAHFKMSSRSRGYFWAKSSQAVTTAGDELMRVPSIWMVE